MARGMVMEMEVEMVMEMEMGTVMVSGMDTSTDRGTNHVHVVSSIDSTKRNISRPSFLMTLIYLFHFIIIVFFFFIYCVKTNPRKICTKKHSNIHVYIYITIYIYTYVVAIAN